MTGSYRINYVFLVFESEPHESEPHECQHLVGVYPSRRDADAVASRLSALADSVSGSCWYRYTVIPAKIGETRSLLDGEMARGLHKIAGDK